MSVIIPKKKEGISCLTLIKIYTDFTWNRFLCDCLFGSEKAAKYAEASFLLPVRQYFGFADSYTKGNRLVLDTPNRPKTIEDKV